jgi:hypothetical protein
MNKLTARELIDSDKTMTIIVPVLVARVEALLALRESDCSDEYDTGYNAAIRTVRRILDGKRP